MNYLWKKVYFICSLIFSNSFRLFKVYVKPLKKTLWTRLKLLITASIKLHIKVILKKQPPGKQPSVIKNNQCLIDKMFLRLKYLFNSKQIDNFWICSSVQVINSVPFSRPSRYSLSSIRVPSESKNRWSLSASIISLARWKRWFMFFTTMGILSTWF